MWGSFVNLLFDILKQIYLVVGDWGLAIIVFTIALRLLMTPLMVKQVRGTHEMQKMQPMIKNIQEKYKDDKDEQAKKMQELYAETGFNPLASCLPMLLQMPLFVALYQMLGASTEKRLGPFAEYVASNPDSGNFLSFLPNLFSADGGVVPGLTASASEVFQGFGVISALPYILLIALFGLSIYIPSLITPNQQANQKTMMISMAVLMLFFGWNTPAGVLLYWDTSSIIGVAQQWFTQKMLDKASDNEELVVVKETKKGK